jgi:hypothetical protein
MVGWYLFTNPLGGICVRIILRGLTFVGGLWTLCDLWKSEIKKGIPIILVWRVLGEMKDRKILYEEQKTNAIELWRLWDLCLVFILFYFFLALLCF